MKGFLKFLSVFAGVLLLSAVLSPILYDFLPFKFERIFQRLVMVFAILAILIFVKIRRETLVRFGMDWRKGSLSLFGAGFLTAFIVLLAFTATELLIGNARWLLRDFSALKWLVKIASCAGAALFIGFLEEFFFRGFVFTSLRDKVVRGNVWLAVTLTSLFYSSLHFISLRKPLIGLDPGFMDSLKLIAAPIQSFADWQGVWPAAIGLFLFGMILNYCVVRSGSLYPSIGLHAGSVFFVRAIGYFVDFLEKHKILLSSKKVYDGALGWFFLLVIGLILHRWLKPGSRLPPKDAPGPGTV